MPLLGSPTSIALPLTVALFALRLTAAPATAPASPALVPAPGLHDGTRFEPQLTFPHDRLAGLQALVDDDVLVHALAGRDGPLLDGGIRS